MESLLGWKMEYWDGCAQLTPRMIGVKTRLDLDSISLGESSIQELTFIEPNPNYAELMLDGYIASFINSVEFCGWPINSIFREADEDISLFFEDKRGKKLSASALLIEPKEQKVVALALITDRPEQGASLELLYVRPEYQRQGIGTRIIQHNAQLLKQQGYSHLTSQYHICNFRSKQFYHKLGFKDVGGDAYYLRIYVGWLRDTIRRRENLKMLDRIEDMKREKERLQDELYILEERHARSMRRAMEGFNDTQKEKD